MPMLAASPNAFTYQNSVAYLNIDMGLWGVLWVSTFLKKKVSPREDEVTKKNTNVSTEWAATGEVSNHTEKEGIMVLQM